jgi:type I site-specific restriction endonuclease
MQYNVPYKMCKKYFFSFTLILFLSMSNNNVGLFKGSTMTLNNPNANTFTTHLSTFTQHLQKDESGRSRMAPSNITSAGSMNNNIDSVEKSVNVMSPFDEQEEWAKISEIMESFGSGIARESVFVTDIENEFRQRLALKDEQQVNGSKIDTLIAEVDENLSPLRKWLVDFNLEHLEEKLLENGYDNPDFLNGLIANENDLEVCGIPEKDRCRLLNEIFKLKKPPTLLDASKTNKLNNNQQQAPSVDKWLSSIHLDDYIDVFRYGFLNRVVNRPFAGHRQNFCLSFAFFSCYSNLYITSSLAHFAGS